MAHVSILRMKVMWCAGAILLLAGITANTLWAEDKAEKEPHAVSDMTLHVIPQSHIDLAWWWRYDPETLDVVVKHTLETAFENMETYPAYTFTYLQVPAIEPLEEKYPDLFYKLRYYAHNPKSMGKRLPNPDASAPKGRLAIGSGLYCEVDGSIPCGESLVRQCVYGKRYFQKEFGIDVRTAWFQDAWTHPWTLPQILKKSGMDSYMFTRPRGQGEPMFWWEGPDGSRVFAYKPFKEGGESLAPENKIEARLSDTSRRYGVKDDITLIGVGNHGGGAIRADVERMKLAMGQREKTKGNRIVPPKMVFSTPAAFVEAALKEPHDFPVIKEELPPTIRGAYTSQSEIKKGNRTCENLLLTLEKAAAISSRLGTRVYPQQEIYEAWKKVMLNQFHDTISGTDILPSIEDALGRYAAVESWAGKELQEHLHAISARIDIKGQGTPMVVFNPLAWERSEIVEAEQDAKESVRSITLRDAAGNPITTQLISTPEEEKISGKVRYVFVADKVPSLGYKTYWAILESGKRSSAPETASEHAFESGFFKIRIDPATGCLASVYDKQFDRELLAEGAKANAIQIIEDFGDSEGFLKSSSGESEHNVWDGSSWETDPNPRMALLENGPVRTILEVKKQFELARFTQRITLYNAIRQIDFDLAIDWEGRNKMVKIVFPLAVSSSSAAYEIPYGTISRPSVGKEQAMQNWVDISQDGWGVSIVNNGRYGCDVRENTVRISVLRSPTEPVAATEEKGVHTVRYSLYPHQGGWQEANTVRRGHEFNNPLITILDTAHPGDLPAEYSFIQVSPANVVLTVLKKAEDSDDLLVRCYESSGTSCRMSVGLSDTIKPDAVHRTDLLENSQREIPMGANGFEAEIGAFAIESYKLIQD
ncbi:MAG TPA: glycoside hydrolase family 38 C-terminal domain-containing protein [Candidatus Hydrogenedentes bacterium]|nr:glycoside hydrolase family 38 C-terminal domain-containing protein [Candidatus Hydrogenedentota bacterium]